MEAQILESRKEVSSPSCGFFFAECEMLAISLSSGLSAIGRQQKKPSSYRRDCLCLLIGSSEQKSTNAASPCSPETWPRECVTRCVCVCVCVCVPCHTSSLQFSLHVLSLQRQRLQSGLSNSPAWTCLQSWSVIVDIVLTKIHNTTKSWQWRQGKFWEVPVSLVRIKRWLSQHLTRRHVTVKFIFIEDPEPGGPHGAWSSFGLPYVLFPIFFAS